MAPIVALNLCDRGDVAGAERRCLAGEDEEDDGKDQQHAAARHPEPRHDDFGMVECIDRGREGQGTALRSGGWLGRKEGLRAMEGLLRVCCKGREGLSVLGRKNVRTAMGECSQWFSGTDPVCRMLAAWVDGRPLTKTELKRLGSAKNNPIV